MSRRPPAAAVLRAGDAGADIAARLVPPGARMRMVGGCTTGYETHPNKIRRRTGLQQQAARILFSIRVLAFWRTRHGEVPSANDVAELVDLIANSLFHLHGDGRHVLSREGVLSWVPPEWHDLIPVGTIGAALEASWPPDRVPSNSEIGRRLKVHLLEVREIADAGSLINFHAVDESAEARAQRRAARRREVSNERRRREKEAAGKGNKTCCISFRKKEGARFVTLRRGGAPARVYDAINSGVTSLQQILAEVGLPEAAIKMALTRLIRAGAIIRTGRGRYAAAGCGAEPHEHAPALSAAGATSSVAHSGPETQAAPPEPASEVEHTVPAQSPTASDGRAPEARETVCDAGPEVSRRPAAITPPNPARRALPSRLPGLLSSNWRAAHAARLGVDLNRRFA